MGKIGKPQKSKKHRKLKVTLDEYQECDEPFGGKRSKLQNLPVTDEELDQQEIPRKVKDIMRNKNNWKTASQKKKNKFNKNKKFKTAADAEFKMERGISKPMQRIPRFVQGKYETDKHFMQRVELETQRVIMKSKIEDKYQIELPDQGPVMSNTIVKKKTSERKREKGKERKKKKMEGKKEKKREKHRDFSALQDEVTFGEVAMAPPSLTAKPRKADADKEKARPGKKSLLLKNMMDSAGNSESSEIDKRPNPKSQSERQVGQTIKRKYLSPVQRQITDFQRQKAIDLYRKMKDTKLKQVR